VKKKKQGVSNFKNSLIMAFNAKGVDVGICTFEEYVGPCVNVWGVEYGASNGRI
jgi:hypothetical protein